MKGKLVLSRKIFQRIYIGSDPEIIIQVTKISGEDVKIMIEADKSIPILREELINNIEENARGI